MAGDIKHEMRQIYYRWCKFRDDNVYKIFLLMYELNADAFDSIYCCPNDCGFIISDFVAPEYHAYCGREIAFFNGRQVCVYWLPGASHSAGGYVKPGGYTIMLRRFALKSPLYLNVTKTDISTRINKISLNEIESESATTLDGGFIPYAAISKELLAWMEKWCESTEKNWHVIMEDQVMSISKLKKIEKLSLGLASKKLSSKLHNLLKKNNVY